MEAWLASLREAGRSPSTVANRYRSLQQFFRWAEEEGEIQSSSMAKMRPPKVAEQPVDVLTEEERSARRARSPRTSRDRVRHGHASSEQRLVHEGGHRRRFAVRLVVAVTKDALDDSRVLSDAIDVILSRDAARALDADLAAGDGSGTGNAQHLTGLANASLPRVALGTTSRTEALITAAETVRDNDWLSPITVILNSADALSFTTETDDGGRTRFADALASLVMFDADRFVSSLAPAGSPFVGAWQEAATLYVRQAPTVDVRPDHASSFAEGLVAVRVEYRVAFRATRARPSWSRDSDSWDR